MISTGGGALKWTIYAIRIIFMGLASCVIYAHTAAAIDLVQSKAQDANNSRGKGVLHSRGSKDADSVQQSSDLFARYMRVRESMRPIPSGKVPNVRGDNILSPQKVGNVGLSSLLSCAWPEHPGPDINRRNLFPYPTPTPLPGEEVCNPCSTPWPTPWPWPIHQWGTFLPDDLCYQTSCGPGEADSSAESSTGSQKVRTFYQAPYGLVLELTQRNQERQPPCEVNLNPDFCLFLSADCSPSAGLKGMRQLVPKVTVHLDHITAGERCPDYDNYGVFVIAPDFRSVSTGEVLFWEIACCKWVGNGFTDVKWGAGLNRSSYPYELIVSPPLSSYGNPPYPTLTPGATVEFLANILPGVLNIIKNGTETSSGYFAFKDRDPENWECIGFYIGWVTTGRVETVASITKVDLQCETWNPRPGTPCP